MDHKNMSLDDIIKKEKSNRRGQQFKGGRNQRFGSGAGGSGGFRGNQGGRGGNQVQRLR